MPGKILTPQEMNTLLNTLQKDNAALRDLIFKNRQAFIITNTTVSPIDGKSIILSYTCKACNQSWLADLQNKERHIVGCPLMPSDANKKAAEQVAAKKRLQQKPN